MIIGTGKNTAFLEISLALAFDKVGTFGADTVPSDVLDVLQQTLSGILSHALLESYSWISPSP